MKNKRFTLSIPFVIALSALVAMFWLAGETRTAVKAADLQGFQDLGGLDSPPSVTDVQPNRAPNDVDTPIVIYGSGFSATLSGTQVISAPLVYLGDQERLDVIWGNTTTLSATVPWGLISDTYSLRVVNPDGISATLQNAFTATNGFGEFVTGGPYGGNPVQLALNPGVTSTVYASMFGAGLFISEDAAGNWAPIHDHDWPIHLDFDSQNPNILYFGVDSNDLYRSEDNGASWERISEDFHTQHGCFRAYPVAHPSQAGHVYFGMGSCNNFEPGEGGVFYSTDYGDTWISRTQGLNDLDVQSLAIHPDTPGTLLAGTQDGNLFYSENGGLNWSWSAQLTGTVTRLYFNPFETLEAWAATSSLDEGRGYLYRSTNLTDWTPLNVNLGLGGGSAQTQMNFLPGSVWLASQSVYSSTNSGVTWNALDGTYRRSTMAIAISPDDHQAIYIGTDFGIEKSTDGGVTWQEMNEGLAALVPSAVVVSPDDPGTVYVKTHQGIFASQNGGNDWRYLDHGIGGYPGGSLLAVDVYSGTRLYLEAGCPDEFCIDISPDGGATWNIVTGTLPSAYAGWASASFAVTPSPHTPGRVLVGASLSPPGSSAPYNDDYVGLFYRSDDYGASWSYIEPTQTISRITEIAYDAFDPNLIYAATSQSGLWRSTDGGDNWAYVPIANVQPPIHVNAIAVHPNVPDKVYIRAEGENDPEPALWISEDAGVTWQPLAYVFLGVDLLVTPPLPDQIVYTLYTGCEQGLCASTNDGQTWQPIPGVPRPEILTAASDGERSIIYLGTPGGLATSAGGETIFSNAASLDDVAIFGGGVYRLTRVLRNNWVYLPTVAR